MELRYTRPLCGCTIRIHYSRVGGVFGCKSVTDFTTLLPIAILKSNRHRQNMLSDTLISKGGRGEGELISFDTVEKGDI